MQPAKKNTLSFGMVSAPVGVCSAKKSDGRGDLKMIAPVQKDEEGRLPESGTPVQQKYMDPSAVTEIDGVQMVPLSALYGREECSRAVERGSLLQPIDAEAYKDLAERIEYMMVVGFVPAKDLGPYYERVTDAHYLQPQGGTPAKPLGLLARAMREERVGAVVRFSVGARERLGVVRVRDDGSLVVLTLEFAARWKHPDEEVESVALVEVTKRERELARSLVQEMTVDASVLDDIRDVSRERQREMVEQVLAGEMPASAAPVAAQPSTDLMDVLEASIREQKKAKPRKRKVAA